MEEKEKTSLQMEPIIKKKPGVAQLRDQLNPKQLLALNQMSAKVFAEMPLIIPNATEEQIERYGEDNQFVRLLFAREFKVEKSMDMWRKWVHWRLEFRADEIKEEEIEQELKSGKAFWHGKDKLNNPVLVVKVKYHLPGVSSQIVVLRHFLYLLEEGIKKCEAAGTGKVSLVWDREGFESKNYDKYLFDTFKKLNTIIQDNYAERLSTVYILHPNWIYKLVFAIIKPFLTERTRSKIMLVNKNSDLLKYFEPEELLEEHGGTSKYVYVYPPPQQARLPEQDVPTIEYPLIICDRPTSSDHKKGNHLEFHQRENLTTDEICEEDEEMISRLRYEYDIGEHSSNMFEKHFGQKQ